LNLSEQVTVSLTPQLLDFLQAEAERESRTVGGQLRHYVVQAARANGAKTAEPWPPVRVPHVEHTPEAITEAKAHLASLQRERDRLKTKPAMDQTAADDDRARALQDDIATLKTEITMAERMVRR
jgi:hypothetical protein